MFNLSTLRPWRNLTAGLAIALLSGCGGLGLQPPVEQPPIDPPQVQGCSTPNHLQLTDIESVVDWINALPKPLELECFIESLPRPLYVNLTKSVLSAQASNGPGNPRIFIFYDKLVMSVVPQEGPGSKPNAPLVNLLELSFATQDYKSIKAEIAFPINKPMRHGEAYDRLDSIFRVTVCGVCHDREARVGNIDGYDIFESEILRPYDGAEIEMVVLVNELKTCNPLIEAHRCAMLKALVGDGDLRWQAFDPAIRVLGDPPLIAPN